MPSVYSDSLRGESDLAQFAEVGRVCAGLAGDHSAERTGDENLTRLDRRPVVTTF